MPVVEVPSMFKAEQVIVGAVVSVEVTSNWQLALFPLLSVAVQLTVVVPRGKLLPDAGRHEADLMPLESDVVGLNVGLISGVPEVGDELMGDGQVITGATVSVLFTLKRHVAVLSPKSVATHVTVVFATGKA